MKENTKIWRINVCFAESLFMTALVSSEALKKDGSIELCIFDYIIGDLGYEIVEISDIRIQLA